MHVTCATFPVGQAKPLPPVMKRGKIVKTDHLWCMDSGADMCFIAEDLLPPDYRDGPPVHAKGAMHPEGKTCATAVFDAEVDGKRTRMLAAIAPRQVLPYPAIVGRNGSELHVQWDVQVMDPQESNRLREQPLPLSNDGDLSQPRGKETRAGETSSQELDENVIADETSIVPLDLDKLRCWLYRPGPRCWLYRPGPRGRGKSSSYRQLLQPRLLLEQSSALFHTRSEILFLMMTETYFSFPIHLTFLRQ